MRCLTIAEELGRRGWSCVWAGSGPPGPLLDRVTETGVRTVALADDSNQRDQLAQAGLGSLDWLVLDHYGLDEAWFIEMAALGGRRMAIDDLGDRPLGAELVLDSGLGATPEKYAGRVPPGADLLLGPRFVPLRREFREQRMAGARRGVGDVRTVLISMGGGDAGEAIARALAAVRAVLPEAWVDVVQGPLSPDLPPALHDPRVRLHRDVRQMASLLLEADLALGAGGGSAWERCAMGVPSLIWPLSRDQQSMAQQLHEAGVAVRLNPDVVADVTRFEDAIRGVAFDRDLRHGMRLKGMELVDAQGTIRIAHQMEGVAMRRADRHDLQRLWEWANDPVTRANSLNSDPIPFDRHCRWFEERLSDAASLVLVGENGAGPLGTVRFDLSEPVAEVSITVAPEHRGGAGRLLLRAALDWFDAAWPDRRLRARIKSGNAASRRIFQRMGFQPDRSAGEVIDFCRGETR